MKTLQQQQPQIQDLQKQNSIQNRQGISTVIQSGLVSPRTNINTSNTQSVPLRTTHAIQGRQVQSPQRVIMQEKVVQQPIYIEKKVIVENNEKINQLQQEIQSLQSQLQQEIQSHQKTISTKPQQIQIEKVVEKPVYYEKETIKEVEVPVEKKVYVDKEKIVEKPVYIDKERLVYIDKPVYKEKLVYIENEEENKRLKDQISYWKQQAEEWKQKYYELENQEVTYQIVKTKISSNRQNKSTTNIEQQHSYLKSSNNLQNNNIYQSYSNNNLKSSNTIVTHSNNNTYDRSSYRNNKNQFEDQNTYIPLPNTYRQQNSQQQQLYGQKVSSLYSSQNLKNSQTIK
ncbi:hypothetical protein PPERSA_09598 [Pseudocohnilembus persalinus]|uniref:Uncharacterized protein n=1 Tax=Pseudocohnilembus persalinus TaxID=266149 RepID=A0A0V0QFV4_PSEPJ|nr:hypothetical protein PPERSA_09598 [Pseudocohnilembus persalinus]|eukprot:KRX00992.1 hypothetical protein PPERSA_09598 [Pseudocohnilembus persalinus]